MTETTPIQLTEAAKDHLQDTARAHGLWRFGVRVALRGKDLKRGFNLSFEELASHGDAVFSSQGLKLFVRQDILEQLDGLTIDHGDSGFVYRMRKP